MSRINETRKSPLKRRERPRSPSVSVERSRTIRSPPRKKSKSKKSPIQVSRSTLNLEDIGLEELTSSLTTGFVHLFQLKLGKCT